MNKYWKTYCLFFLLLAAESCSVIDEDLSNCGEQAKLDYELRLVTNMTTELRTELTTQTDLQIAQALRDELSNVFSDFAHDVDLSFYDTKGDSARLQHDEHFMDANQASYELNLPMRHYMHLATANILDNKLVTLEEDERCHHSILRQIDRDTIDSHTTGIFTARQPMEVLEGIDQNFKVHLYMANCAAALVLDTQGYDISGMQVYTTGFATRFFICDSTFAYPRRSPIVRTTKIAKSEDSQAVAFCSVNFPSRAPSKTRTVIETTEPFIAQPGDEVLWEFRVYVPSPNSTHQETTYTETRLLINEMLNPGQLTIVKGRVGENGVIIPDSPEVGTSVTLDWKEGLIIGN